MTDGTRSLGLEPHASHPAVTGRARQGGDRSRTLTWGYVTDHTADPSNRRAHSTQATSCRTIPRVPFCPVGCALDKPHPPSSEGHSCVTARAQRTLSRCIQAQGSKSTRSSEELQLPSSGLRVVGVVDRLVDPAERAQV